MGYEVNRQWRRHALSIMTPRPALIAYLHPLHNAGYIDTAVRRKNKSARHSRRAVIQRPAAGVETNEFKPGVIIINEADSNIVRWRRRASTRCSRYIQPNQVLRCGLSVITSMRRRNLREEYTNSFFCEVMLYQAIRPETPHGDHAAGICTLSIGRTIGYTHTSIYIAIVNARTTSQ